MNIESRRCSNEINQVDYIFSYLISQYTINSNLQSKCDNVSQLPQYTYSFGSFDGMVNDDAFSSLKALRKTTREPFKRGSLISIERSKDSSAYDTFIIGSTDPDFFRGLCLSYYSEPYYFKYSNGVWTE